jgi:hypothetical protein
VDQPTALDLLKRGEISAVVSVAAKPVAIVANFDGGDRFHLLHVPYVDQLADRYFPATLSSKDYPKLLQEGAAVDTLSVGTVLGRLQLAGEHGSLQAHRALCRGVLLQVRHFPCCPSPSEVARGEPECRGTGLEAFPCGPRMARQEQRNGDNSFDQSRRLQKIFQRAPA